ncbi:MAG TPA: protein kinase, partial [Caulobacteraceae bacterium]|nr:protein kinase [Caulobacteraceae bacterium]
EGQKFDEAKLMALLRPIGEGLNRAHQIGVTHRDIKPANILVDNDGRPVLIDFGSARFESGQATSTKVTFYTPPYAALEQYIKTYPQGPWTDIYALGVVLYQCITGEKPPEVLERLHGGLGEALSARDWPGYSPGFIRAVDAGMGIRPSDRPQTVAAWLKMFDEPDLTLLPAQAPDEEATRVSSASVLKEEASRAARLLERQDALAAAAAAAAASPAAPPPAAASVDAPADAAGPNAFQALLQASSPRVKLLAGAGAAVILAAILGLVFLQRHPSPRPTGPAAAGSPPLAQAPAAAPAAAPLPSSASPNTPVAAAPAPGLEAATKIDQQARALLSTAASAGRPVSETGSISAGVSRIGALTSQIRSAGGDKAPALLAQLNAEATGLSKGEAAAVAQSAKAQSDQSAKLLADLGQLSSPQAAAALSAGKRAQAQLTKAVGDANATEPRTALNGARTAIGASRTLTDALVAARPIYGAVKRATLTALVAEVRSMAGDIVADAQAPKPGLFASHHTRETYQKLQDNAARAKSAMADLDQLARSVQGADPDQIQAALVRGASIRQSMSLLRADSAAAAAPDKS